MCRFSFKFLKLGVKSTVTSLWLQFSGASNFTHLIKIGEENVYSN